MDVQHPRGQSGTPGLAEGLPHPRPEGSRAVLPEPRGAAPGGWALQRGAVALWRAVLSVCIAHWAVRPSLPWARGLGPVPFLLTGLALLCPKGSAFPVLLGGARQAQRKSVVLVHSQPE